MLTVLLLGLSALLAPDDTPPWAWESLELADGTRCEFAVQLPPGHADEVAAPLLLALPPGDQSRPLVERALELYWSAGAAERGWILVSPAAPEGGFRGDGLEVLEQLLDALEARYTIEGGRAHLAGVSNGGRSAFAWARRAPERFASLIGAPGMAPPETDVRPLASLPTSLFVGGADEGWREPMERLHDELQAHGAASTQLVVFDGEAHMPASLTGEMLFGALQQHRARARLRQTEREAIGELLDGFHRAAAEADEEAYFALFAPEGVFVGTDASERWSVAEFRAYAHPHFAAGTGWTYRSVERHVRLAPDGRSAWFDELLRSPKYGIMRGSGNVRRVGTRWRVAQYVLSFAVPNEVAPGVVELIAEQEGEG